MSENKRTLAMGTEDLSVEAFDKSFKTAKMSITRLAKQCDTLVRQQKEILNEYDRRAKEWN